MAADQDSPEHKPESPECIESPERIEGSEHPKGQEGPQRDANWAVLKHHRATRWMHWINFPLLVIMIWSGLRIYWADVRDPFGFGVGLIGWHWFDFMPDFVNQKLGLERRLARGMAFHFTFGWFFVINGLAFVLYTAFSGEWRHLLPQRRSWSDAVQVLMHDLGLRSGELPPQGRYNGAQRITYTLILVLGAVAVATGFAIYKPTQLNLLTSLFGGYERSRTIHFVTTLAFIGFFVIHIVQVARAGMGNFMAMITGYEKADQPGGAAVAPADAHPSSGMQAPTETPTPRVVGVQALAPNPPTESRLPVMSPAQYRSRTRRSVLTGGVAAVVGLWGWRWLHARPDDNRIPDLLRHGHEFNEGVWRSLSRESAMAPTFDRSLSSQMRVNGRHGLESPLNLATWEMVVEGPNGGRLGSHALADIESLPKVSMTIEHKCVEGWSHIVTWGGARFSDFAAPYLAQLGRTPPFVGLATPDGAYYVGLDIESALHPQTMLTYQLQDEPLSLEHGAPLRLTTPNKYGIKQLKRIGTIRFSDQQPTDYWYERGYDWYAQL